LIAPLAISDARQLKAENTSRCAVREFLYGSQKPELGDSLVKVLFWKAQSSRKIRHSVFPVSNFFHELLDWQVTDRLRRCIRLRAPACLRAPCRKRL
jgi:hypothetical protein